MKLFKKMLFLFLASGIFLGVVGCENTNEIRTVTFSDLTAAGSDKATIKIVFEKDERVKEKDFDVQVRSKKPQIYTVYKELEEEKYDITFSGTNWNSLTTLLSSASNKEDEEDFKKYKDVQSLTYIFSSKDEGELTFRVVVGTKVLNASKKGYILTNSKEVSEEFKLKVTKTKS